MTKRPDKLIARIAVDSKYWMWINGELAVLSSRWAQAWSFTNGTYYDKVDIAPYLKEGNNTIAILLWHFGKQGFSHNSSGQAALIFEAISPELKILSDKSWLCVPNSAYSSTDARIRTTASPGKQHPLRRAQRDARLEYAG